MDELHIVIDWTCHFDLNTMQNMINSSNLTLKNIHFNDPIINKKHVMSLFYNTNVDDFRGQTPFNIYIINDNKPKYEYRNTSKGLRKVNSKLFDLKTTLRKITGGYKIHATDNIQETKDNLRCLSLFDKYYNQKVFKDISHVFDTLNFFSELKWVVMRNFEEMPSNVTIDEHLDIDLLVNDYFLVKTILDAESATDLRYDDGGPRILNFVYIGNTKILFDFRQVGDNYYDINFQQKMLDTRITLRNFYTPNNEFHIFGLIYHAIIHKPAISDTYKKVFIQYGIEEQDINIPFLKMVLDNFMIQNNFKYVRPEPSVGFFIE
tara:strand:- start:3081 stop:4040 length:960 start_codon:yes stop_codon:yes gene_type:complete